ncbi:hypothetical protein K0M31_018674 [Melipona bicolor]|uniref:Uncharacterized protein n=1 Tax=Melipona bicolor TaxID=60889 RepID=A0AA40G3Q5_9HYME|nr:hypothetical protein K0M31_018674 [Melipona bicolor]
MGTSVARRIDRVESRVCESLTRPASVDSRSLGLFSIRTWSPKTSRSFDRGPSRSEDETRGLAFGGKGWWNEGFLAGQRLSARLRAPTPPPRSRLKAPCCYIGTVLSPSEGACLSDVQVRTGG